MHLGAQAGLKAEQVEQLLRTTKLEKAGIGRFDAAVDLTGSGNSIARILGASNGKVGLVVPAGEVSAEIMAMVAIDLWRIAKFKLAGDEPVHAGRALSLQLQAQSDAPRVRQRA